MSSRRSRFPELVAGLVVLGIALALIVWLRRPPVAPSIPVPPPQDTPRQDLVQNDGRWHRKGETNAFNGWMVDFYRDGARLSRSQLSNGLLNGVSESWYTNGQMQVREHFKDNVSDGLREKWHENGARLSQATIVEGKVTGTFQSWHSNGQLAERIEMKSGQPDGVAWAYYPSGFLKSQTTVRDGRILEQTSWKDGERRNP